MPVLPFHLPGPVPGAWLPHQGRNRARAQLPSDRLCSILRELQEKERALRLQKERLQKELEEKKKKVKGGACGPHRVRLSSGQGGLVQRPWCRSCPARLCCLGLAWGRRAHPQALSPSAVPGRAAAPG